MDRTGLLRPNLIQWDRGVIKVAGELVFRTRNGVLIPTSITWTDLGEGRIHCASSNGSETLNLEDFNEILKACECEPMPESLLDGEDYDEDFADLERELDLLRGGAA